MPFPRTPPRMHILSISTISVSHRSVSYALRGCSHALLAAEASASFMFAGCYRRRSLAVDGGSGASRGHAPVMRRPDSRRSGAVERPSVFQAGHIPSWRGSCERYALSPVAAVSRWLLLLLSPLLSVAGPVPYLRGLLGAVTEPCPPRPLPPNPTAAGPDARRVLSSAGAADHEVTLKALWKGSG